MRLWLIKCSSGSHLSISDDPDHPYLWSSSLKDTTFGDSQSSLSYTKEEAEKILKGLNTERDVRIVELGVDEPIDESTADAVGGILVTRLCERLETLGYTMHTTESFTCGRASMFNQSRGQSSAPCHWIHSVNSCSIHIWFEAKSAASLGMFYKPSTNFQLVIGAYQSRDVDLPTLELPVPEGCIPEDWAAAKVVERLNAIAGAKED